MAHGEAQRGLESQDGEPVEILKGQGRNLLLTLDPASHQLLTSIADSLSEIKTLLSHLSEGR